MPTIPSCDELFVRYFAPWYQEDDRHLHGVDGTRPDMLRFADHVGKSASELSPLHDNFQARYVEHLAVTMTDAAIEDFGTRLNLASPVDFSWIQAIDDHYDVERIAALIAESDPAEDGNPYFIACVELGALIAKMLQSLAPDLEWMADSPYWESALWHPASGHVIPPTHWAIKKLSDYGWNDRLVPKIHCCAKTLRGDAAH